MSSENIADESRSHKKRKKERLEALRDDNDLRFLLNEPSGRNFIWWMLTICGVFEISYRPNDPYGTTFREGSRSVGNQLLARINEVNPEAYLLMIKEHQGERNGRTKSESGPESESE